MTTRIDDAEDDDEEDDAMTFPNQPYAPGSSGAGSSGPNRPAGRSRNLVVVPAISIVVFIAALWLIEGIDVLSNHRLDQYGIEPRDTEGLRGVVFAPLLHADFDHLASNSVPALILGFAAMVGAVGRFIAATVIVWVISGLGTWFTGGAGTMVVGLSGVIFGWLTYVLVRGFVNRVGWQILVGVLALALYGGMLVGVVPGSALVSWQAHLFGAIGGVVAAFVVSGRKRNSAPPSVRASLG